MNELFNAVSVFFKETLVNFMSENWLIIDAVCTALMLLAIIVGIVNHKRAKKLKKSNALLTEEVSARDSLLRTKEEHIKEYVESEAHYEYLIKSMAKDHAEEVKVLNEAHDNDMAAKILKIDSLTAENDRLATELTNLVNTKEELDNEYLETLEKNTKLNRTILELSERYEELEKKHNALLIENDFLKNYEVENGVLIKTLRRLREDEENDTAKAKDAIVALENRLNKKIETTFAAMTSKIVETTATSKPVDLDDELSKLKRSELSKMAKKLGISNFATWSNAKLIEKIKECLKV